MKSWRQTKTWMLTSYSPVNSIRTWWHKICKFNNSQQNKFKIKMLFSLMKPVSPRWMILTRLSAKILLNNLRILINYKPVIWNNSKTKSCRQHLKTNNNLEIRMPSILNNSKSYNRINFSNSSISQNWMYKLRMSINNTQIQQISKIIKVSLLTKISEIKNCTTAIPNPVHKPI